jgi:hypothetical protein
MSTILIPITLGMTYRNVVYSGLLSELSKSNDIIIVTPYFVQISKELAILNNSRIKVLNCPVYEGRSNLASKSYRILEFGMWIMNKPKVKRYRINWYRKNSKISYFILLIMGWLSNKLIMYFPKGDAIRDLIYYFDIRKYIHPKIDCVLSFTVSIPSEQCYQYSAMRDGIKVVSMPHSWDNLSVKTIFPFTPDVILVWNKIMLEEIACFHPYLNSKVFIVGPLQYESYRGESNPIIRKDLLNIFNISNPEARIVTYATTSELSHPDELDFVNDLISVISGINENYSIHIVLIIRAIPSKFLPHYKKIVSKYDFIRLDVVNGGFLATVDQKMKFSDQSVRLFTSLIDNSDIVINLASTITLDAAFFDTPIINIGYNSTYSPNCLNSALEWYDTDHFKNVKKYSAYKIVKSKRELCDAILSYLEDPTQEQAGRKSVSESQIGYLSTISKINKYINL